MRAVGNYNKISPELQKLIPKLTPKGVTFQMLNGIKNTDPNPMERQKQPYFYPKQNIPMKDRIFDKFANGGEGAWVDIVVADGWKDEEPQGDYLFFPFEHGTVPSGKFTLYSNNAKHEQIYEFIMLCNLNKDAVTGEHRDTSVRPILSVIDFAKERKETTNKRDILMEALQLSSRNNLKVKDAREIARSLNWNEYTDDEELLSKVEDFAREKPEDFLNTYKDNSREFKSVIKEALAKNIVKYDIQTGEFKVGNEFITTVPLEDRTDVLIGMSKWFKTNKNGEKVLENIKHQLSPKKEPALA